MAKTNLTAERLRALLHYAADTGIFTWNICPRYNVPIHSVAGHVSKEGYRVIGIGLRVYKAHRLAFLYMNSEWPEYQVDHIDGNKDNNSFANLRDVTKSINLQNQKRAQSSNKSCGLLGASPNGARWVAKIRHQGTRIYIGNFKTPELAHEAYLEVKRKLHVGCTI